MNSSPFRLLTLIVIFFPHSSLSTNDTKKLVTTRQGDVEGSVVTMRIKRFVYPKKVKNTMYRGEKKKLQILLSYSQAGPGRNISQPRTKTFSRLCICFPSLHRINGMFSVCMFDKYYSARVTRRAISIPNKLS